jgi:hypothetical protein
LGLLSVLLAAGLGVGVGLAQAPRPIGFPGGDITGMTLRRGQVGDFGAVLGAMSSQTIILVRVDLVPVSGYAVPRLSHVAVISHGALGSDRGWPPPLLAGDTLSPIRDLPVRVTTTALNSIVYGVTAVRGVTQYAWDGVDVTYLLDGDQFTSETAQGGVLCLIQTGHATCSTSAAMAAVEAAQSP